MAKSLSLSLSNFFRRNAIVNMGNPIHMTIRSRNVRAYSEKPLSDSTVSPKKTEIVCARYTCRRPLSKELNINFPSILAAKFCMKPGHFGSSFFLHM